MRDRGFFINIEGVPALILLQMLFQEASGTLAARLAPKRSSLAEEAGVCLSAADWDRVCGRHRDRAPALAAALERRAWEKLWRLHFAPARACFHVADRLTFGEVFYSDLCAVLDRSVETIGDSNGKQNCSRFKMDSVHDAS